MQIRRHGTTYRSRYGMNERSQGLHHGYPVYMYYAWRDMKRRCLNPKAKDFKHYGGRGITICDRWLGDDGYVNFCKDLGLRPKGYTLDRINNDGNYEPNNCRWASWVEQANNKRSRVILSRN